MKQHSRVRNVKGLTVEEESQCKVMIASGPTQPRQGLPSDYFSHVIKVDLGHPDAPNYRHWQPGEGREASN